MARATTAKKTTTAAAEPRYELVHRDPRQLVIGANARLDPRVDKGLVASIRERGVLQPIVAHLADNGDLVVIAGQRRTLAAVQAGRDRVPVVIAPEPGDADRLVDQVTENIHRDPLTPAERVAAAEQLTLLGVTPAQIAKRTALPRDQVDQALAVAKSPTAAAALAQHPQLTLDQAAALVEFEDDEDAVASLVAAIDRGRGIDHEVQRLRDERAQTSLRDKAIAELVAAGVKVVERHAGAHNLDYLAHDGTDLTPEAHAGCPGHAAWVDVDWHYESDDEPEDPNAEDPGEWKADTVYVCTDAAGQGHTYRSGSPIRTSSGTGAVERSEADREQEREQRRTVIANNKAWKAAQTVRREWLRRFAARRTAPKTAAAFIASSLAWCDHHLTGALQDGHTYAHELLGLDRGTYGERGIHVDRHLATGNDARALHVALVLILAAYEERLFDQAWRGGSPGAARYLEYLAGEGYQLSDVEQLACRSGDG